MKALRFILSGLLILAAVGLLCYQYFVEGHLETNDIIKAGIIILGAVASLFKAPKKVVTNKKALYQKAYEEFIHNAFYDEPKLERLFYNAVHDYNQNKPAAAVAKLEKLRGECQRTDELYAVTVFTAFCLDDMRLFDKAITQYDAAVRIRGNSTLYSNKALCLQKLGQYAEAEECYQQAIQCNPKNEYPYNNLSALYFREEDYESALELAEEAIEINPKMRQALTTAAICCALLGYNEEYEQYYRQAVVNGADGSAIKRTIKSLDPTL